MKIALAQIKPRKGNINANILNHIKWIEDAKAQNCNAIFFPELSITGYEPELAQELGMSIDDSRLDVFQDKSDSYKMTIAVGVPTIVNDHRLISMIVFQPNEVRLTYSKQLLHDDELTFFVHGTEQKYISINSVTIAPAICYESIQTKHFTDCLQQPFDIYLASVAKPERAIDNAQKHYSKIAKQFQKPILMVNAVGPCDNFIAGGKTSFCDNNGNIINKISSEVESLLMYKHKS